MLEQRTAPREPFISEILFAMKGKAHQDISRDLSVSGIAMLMLCLSKPIFFRQKVDPFVNPR